MNVYEVAYRGNKHCTVTNLDNNATIETDAPLQYGGLGKEFSPTDLLAAALGSCVMTTMAFAADKMKADITGASLRIAKEIGAKAGHINKLLLDIRIPDETSPETKQALETAIAHCPVKKSLSGDVQIEIRLQFGQPSPAKGELCAN